MSKTNLKNMHVTFFYIVAEIRLKFGSKFANGLSKEKNAIYDMIQNDWATDTVGSQGKAAF